MVSSAWLIPVFPLLSYFVLIFAGRRLGNRAPLVAIGAMGLSTLFAVLIFAEKAGGAADVYWRTAWAVAGGRELSVGYMVDNLAAAMLAMITFVGTLIFVYAAGYMKGDPYYSRFFAFLSLFCFGMLTMVLANSFLLMLIGWEIIGLCSYLLIGFYFRRKSANMAQMKAFMTTRVGDLFMLIGILMVFAQFGTVDYKKVFDAAGHALAPGATHIAAATPAGPAAPAHAAPEGPTVDFLGLQIPLLTLTALMIFGGPIGKSGQFPLHVWLPDAMEGPTPVSALIHAATMVAAGVYLVGRAYPLFFASPGHGALTFVAWTGTITALMAAFIAIAQDDIKRILAYSTISQLGFMMAGLGVLGYTAGLFHLLTHAFFKALLFLGAGSVIHAVHSNSIKDMGGLRKHMPITFWTFTAGYLALSGIFPFAGFWSKDEILLEASHHNAAIYGLLTLGAFLTAMYMTRLMAYTFFGAFRGAKEVEPDPWLPEDHARARGEAPRSGKAGKRAAKSASRHGDAHGHGERHDHGHAAPHESPPAMTVPLIVLALCALLVGLVGAPGTGKDGGSWFHGFVHFHGFEAAGIKAPPFSWPKAIQSLFVALAGIFTAYAVYGLRIVRSETLRENFAPIHAFLANRMYLDRLYAYVFIRGGLGLAALLRVFDQRIIDGTVNLVGGFTLLLSRIYRFLDTWVVDGAVNLVGLVTRWISLLLRPVQTGRTYNYLLLAAFGLFLIVVIGLWRL
jgi:NADH-quinone oxidoreductase subunit L